MHYSFNNTFLVKDENYIQWITIYRIGDITYHASTPALSIRPLSLLNTTLNNKQVQSKIYTVIIITIKIIFE